MRLIRWSNLGFPTKEGHYYFDGMDIWVRQFDVRRAKEWLDAGNDDAIFQLLIIEQVSGPTKFMLGGMQTPGRTSHQPLV
jgi:hypothetical protein